MFEKYDISELYLASIHVIEANIPNWKMDISDVLVPQPVEYTYPTIVRVIGDHQMDLANPERPIRKSRNSRITSYILEYTEPLSDYYTQDGKRKQTFSRRSALKEGEKHYNEFHQKRLALT